jgi:hypothetical protein
MPQLHGIGKGMVFLLNQLGNMIYEDIIQSWINLRIYIKVLIKNIKKKACILFKGFGI